jgi:hypothetical protein
MTFRTNIVLTKDTKSEDIENQMKKDYIARPLREVGEEVRPLTNSKTDVIYQTFKCSNCGYIQIVDVPNTFFGTGECEKCNHVTNMNVEGCNCVLIRGPKPLVLTE